ncbi:hypothetical protein HK100_002185 [Physocladia obscura]|uniref:Phosphatidylinositol 4-kinase n=1 Tax=Physocladia obscura TaxID=109957 RepID=A0AAD5TBL2_9FUNG|nr:hypothetical protein HK100_002185 [Physocladia obscura]
MILLGPVDKAKQLGVASDTARLRSRSDTSDASDTHSDTVADGGSSSDSTSHIGIDGADLDLDLDLETGAVAANADPSVPVPSADSSHASYSSHPRDLPDSLAPRPPPSSKVPSITPVDASLFAAIVRDVQLAISQGIYPERIVKGSSGSYFCKNRAGNIVAVFKPKNEEPYGKMNPKWTKWLHKNLLPCCFGRSCLIPNSGYLSEAAASFIDERLELNVVPRTEVVALASPTFSYSWYEKWMYMRGGGISALPLKLGSFQLFLTGFKDATTFFQNGYDQALLHTSTATGAHSITIEDNTGSNLSMRASSSSSSTVSLSSPSHPLNWDAKTQAEFQVGFERLVVLDYLIRNTDRGMDNWMIRYNTSNTTPEAVIEPRYSSGGNDENNNNAFEEQTGRDYIAYVPPPAGDNCITVAAIDNGLAFPFKHPDKWRSYPYGWAYLPIAKIPFSKSTRDHMLYFLTSQKWWNDTLDGLERIFRIDPDFNDDMWRRQRSVIRGQGYNLAEVLRRSEINDAGYISRSSIRGETAAAAAIAGSPWGLVRRPVVAVYEEDDQSDQDELEENDGDEASAGSAGYNDRVALIGGAVDAFVPAGNRNYNGGDRNNDGIIRRFRRRVRQRFETFTRSQPFFQHF